MPPTGHPEALREGAEHFRAGHLPAARVALERAVAFAPNDFEAWNLYGATLARLGEFAAAVPAFERATALEPRAPQAWLNLGNARAGLGAFDAAALDLERALAADPGFLPARNALGSLRLKQQRPAEALGLFDQIRAVDPDFPRIEHNRGAALQALGQLEPAIAAYREALRREPGDLNSLNDLSIVLLRAGQPEAALETCARCLALSPANRKPLAYRAAALIELGRRDEARALLDFTHLLFRQHIAAPAGHASVTDFNAALVAHVLAHPTLRYEPPDKATRGGYQSGELLVEPKGAMAGLEAAIRAAVPAFMAEVRATQPAHPWVAGLPARWQLASWAVVLKAQGHQGPHFHPDGYISGVYYAQLPGVVKAATDTAGCIEFGRTADAIGGRAPPLLEVVRPEEGLLLMFPSYFYHRTLPFDGPEPRICVAFDVLPR